MTGYYGGYTEYLPNCHTGLTKVMRIGEADIYIGKGVDALAEGGWALMVSCAGSGVAYAPENPVKANKEAREFLPADVTTQPPPPFLSIDWPDGSTPSLTRSWWERLHAALKTVKGDVVFYCHGGHGRSGTAVAILAAIGGEVVKKGKDPVRWLRKVYCDKVVETTSQIEYIERMSGAHVDVDGSHLIAARIKEAVAAKAKANGAAPTTVSTPPTPSGQQTFVLDAAGKLVRETPATEVSVMDGWVKQSDGSWVREKDAADQDWSGSHWKA